MANNNNLVARLDNENIAIIDEINDHAVGENSGIFDETTDTLHPFGVGGGGVFIANYIVDGDDITLDKTYADFKNAMLEGKTLYTCEDQSNVDPQYGYKKFHYLLVTDLSETFEHLDEGPSDAYSVMTSEATFNASTEDGVLIIAS